MKATVGLTVNPTAKTVINGEHLFWMPGLVDGHMHTGQQLLKGAVLDELPMIWTRIMLPFESTLTSEKMHLSASIAACEMLKNGTLDLWMQAVITWKQRQKYTPHQDFWC